MDKIRAAVLAGAFEEDLIAAMSQEPSLRFVFAREVATMFHIADLVHRQPRRHRTRQLHNGSEREYSRLLMLDQRISGAFGNQPRVASLVRNYVVLVAVVRARDRRLGRRASQ